MSYLNIKAGKNAKKILLEKGFRRQDIRIVAGATLGPKWLIMSELDKYIFGTWLDKKKSLVCIGASAGAWRMAAATQQNPIAATNRLEKAYIEQSYKEIPSPQEVSHQCKLIIQTMLGDNGVQEVLDSKWSLNVLTSKALFHNKDKGLKWQLVKSAMANFISRKALNSFFERNLFTSNSTTAINLELDPIKTKVIELTKENLLLALLASGSIPTVIQPIDNIPDAPGIHWDGGITDYHINVEYDTSEGLVLYPHYSSQLMACWFDKFVPYRNYRPSSFENTILIYPNQDFVRSLPDQKIPCRKDFETYFQRDDIRINNWYQATEQGKLLQEEFESWVTKGIDPNKIHDL